MVSSREVEVRGLSVVYGKGRRRQVALDGIDLSVGTGESVGIVGESGSGKSTLAKALVGLVQPTSGEVRLAGEVVRRRRTREQTRALQMVFQDPSSSLNPSMRIGVMLQELVRFHRMRSGEGVHEHVRELVDLVGLPASTLRALPRSLSGGQRQRVGIARALALEPTVLIADESVSALDVSVQATILNLLADLRHDLGLTLIFISHDLSVVRHVSERVVVMRGGRILEDQPTARIFAHPEHPYTQGLIAAAPHL